jgi:hypothetical protein
MAKPLSPKSQLIREALKANPKLGNADLAKLINSSDVRKGDKIKVTATDVGNQRQALKAMSATARKKTKAPKKALAATAANKPQAARAQSMNGATKAVSPVDLVDRVFDLAERCGGFAQLKELVDRISAAREK